MFLNKKNLSHLTEKYNCSRPLPFPSRTFPIHRSSVHKTLNNVTGSELHRCVFINGSQQRVDYGLYLLVGRINCCWPSPARSFLVPSPAVEWSEGSQSCHTVKYGYEARRIRNQESLCWRGPPAT
jgi:hypothetical protein